MSKKLYTSMRVYIIFVRIPPYNRGTADAVK